MVAVLMILVLFTVLYFSFSVVLNGVPVIVLLASVIQRRYAEPDGAPRAAPGSDGWATGLQLLLVAVRALSLAFATSSRAAVICHTVTLLGGIALFGVCQSRQRRVRPAAEMERRANRWGTYAAAWTVGTAFVLLYLAALNVGQAAP